MISKEKGNIGEVIALAEFVKRGVQVSIPYGDNARYDLIAEFNGKLNRIQVKYCNQLSSNNSVICPCASSTNHTTNKHYSTYENDIDYFSVSKYPTIKFYPGNQKDKNPIHIPNKLGIVDMLDLIKSKAFHKINDENYDRKKEIENEKIERESEFLTSDL